MSLVSVLIPTYNRSKYLPRAIQSVLVQTYADLEVIVVDDGSTDDTAQIVGEYTRKDPRIRLIRHSARRGAQAARNIGIRAAQGEWIAFLDSDDQWLPDSLALKLQLATAKGLHVVHTDFYKLEPPRHPSLQIKLRSRHSAYIVDLGSTELQPFGLPSMQGYIYRELLRRPGPMFQGLLVSKKALSRIGYLDESIISYQEWDTTIRLAKYYEFGFVSRPTFIYDCRHADTLSKDLLRTAMGYEQVFTKQRWSILRYLGPRALASHYQTAAGLYHNANDEAMMYRCLVKAMLFWPFRPKTIFRRVQRFIRLEFQR